MAFSDPRSPSWEPLLKVAWQAWEQAHAPYSGFRVGAALLLADGTVVPGCNVENASHPVALCAERTAVCAAVSRGMKPGDPAALVVVTEAPNPTPPCGACRQVLAEFAEDLPILLANRSERDLCRLKDLLPRAFTGRDLVR
jgi:cytidine deaminase